MASHSTMGTDYASVGDGVDNCAHVLAQPGEVQVLQAVVQQELKVSNPDAIVLQVLD